MSRTPSTRGLALLTLPAAALVAVGTVVAVRPALLLERAPELEAALAAVDPGTVVLALAVLLVVFAPTLGLTGRLRPSRPSPLVAEASATGSRPSSDDRSPSGRTDVVGAAIAEQIRLATAYDSEPRDVREDARRRLLESLRPIAATAYGNRAGVTADEAMAAIEAGTWTDDPRAAAFLAAPAGPSMPLWLWLLDLVRTADPFRRHLEGTLEEIERLQSSATVTRSNTESGTEAETETETDESVAATETDRETETERETDTAANAGGSA